MTKRYGPWPPSRPLARAMGSRFFFTSRPCAHGHLSPRLTLNGVCLECKRERERPASLARLSRLKANETPEQRAKTEARYRERHREKRNAMKRDDRLYSRFMDRLAAGEDVYGRTEP